MELAVGLLCDPCDRLDVIFWLVATAAQAVLGAAKMVLESGKHPGELKDQVTSPSGSTIEGVQVLDERGFRGTVIAALRTAVAKARSL